MNSPEFLTLLPLMTTTAYTLLLIVSFLRRSQQENQARWFLVYVAVSVVWEFLLFFASDLNLPSYFALKALLVGTLSLGLTTAVYVRWPRSHQWLLLGGIAIFIAILADIFLPNQSFFVPLLNANTTYRGLVSFLAWFVLSSYIVLQTWRDYRHTQFPWHANRLLFWIIALTITYIGEALLFFLWSGLIIAGQMVRFLGVVALAYAVASHRVFDVRTRWQRMLALSLVTLISALPMLGAIWLLNQIATRYAWTDSIQIGVTLATLAVSFFLYEPFRHLIQNGVYRYLIGEGFDINQVLRQYSQATSRTLDVRQLVLVVISTISELLGTNRGAVLLLTKNDTGYQVQAVPAMGHISPETAVLPLNSRVLQTLTQQQQPLLQYELDFNPTYTSLADSERAWLREMGMEVYVPIRSGTDLEGIIVVGPKQTGIPYQPDELEMMQTLADQTVIALQNARLYTELETRNEKVRELNLDLISQNERLGIMDKVKSDFITIASHELRTPLTQVKGYADILAAMNDENILTRDQTREIVSHINRAALQLEGLITAMLDASQIDVAGMQLTFMETTLEVIIRLAADPLRNAIRERRLEFATEGLAAIPPVQADFKRMVQCFTNLIGNAIKYTPDYGRITVTAHLLPTQNGESDHVEVVITDTGIGIDPKYHSLIFEKFFRIGDPQLHSTGNTKFKGAGPGLGLPIAKGVIEAHSGRIWVESPGEDEKRLPGSQFHIILPLRPPEPVRQAQQNRRRDLPSYMIQ